MAPACSTLGRVLRGFTLLVVTTLVVPSFASTTPQDEEAAPVESVAPVATTEPDTSEALRGGGGGGGGGGHGDVETYDYIVIGSGPGGAPVACNLAKANHTVLLLEAGDDQSEDLTTQIMSLTTLKKTTRWDFYVKHYDDDEQTLRHNYLTWRRADGSLWIGPGATAPEDAELLGIYYPRGATLGGSSVINYASTWLPNDSEWDDIASSTGDSSWSSSNMREIFASIEKNHYVPPGTPGHGFDGYFETNSNDGTAYEVNNGTTAVLKAMVGAFGDDDPNDVINLVQRDGNALDPNRDQAVGLYALPFHVNEIWKRISARDLVLDTIAAGHPLTLRTHSLATRLLFRSRPGREPRAVGFEYLEGESVYKADPRHEASDAGVRRKARARREVVVSGGVYNTPQLLKLSGVGPRAELRSHRIPVLVDLPGVGENLRDNQEIPVVGVGKEFFFPPPNPDDPACTFGAPGDPCIDAFLNGTGPYTRAGFNSHAFMLKTNHTTTGDRDTLIFSGPFAFRAFYPPEAEISLPADPPNLYGLSVVRMNPGNKAGTVKLRSSDPTDTPDINFHYFTGRGGREDLEAMAEVAAWGRAMYTTVGAPYGPIDTIEPPCEAGEACGAIDKQWIKDQAWGHHPTGTCQMGRSRGDRMSVVDSKFRVKGVKGLRVADASIFPRTPGAFPVVSTFMIGEKASRVIGDAFTAREVLDVDEEAAFEEGTDEI